MPVTEILHHLSACHSINIELGGTGVQVMQWRMYVYRGGAGYLPPTEERKGILVFLVLQNSSCHQLLPEDQIHHWFESVLVTLVPPVCSSYAGKMRYMADAERYTANYTQHYTQHY